MNRKLKLLSILGTVVITLVLATKFISDNFYFGIKDDFGDLLN